MLNKTFLNSRLSGIERSISFFKKIIKFYFNRFLSNWNRTVHYLLGVSIRCEKRKFYFNGLELCTSIRSENFRCEY